MRTTQLLIGLFLLLTCYVQAQNGDDPKRQYTYEELMTLSLDNLLDLNVDVQVVSKEGGKILNSPSTVTIINQNTIRNYNFQTIGEALSIIPGFSVFRTYLKRDVPTSRGIMQDHYANKVLLLINGVPTYNSITGEGILERIDIHDVERIEVLKGPASVLYGSNALCGAINIVLKTGKYSGVESHAGFGYHGFMSAGAQTSAEIKNTKLFFSGNSLSHLKKNVTFIDEKGEEGFIEDNIQNQNFTLMLSRGGHSMLINGYNNIEGYLGVLNSYSTGAGIEHKLQGYLMNYRFNKSFSQKTSLSSSLSLDWNQRYLPRDREDSIISHVSGSRIAGDLHFIHSPFSWLSLSADALYDYKVSLNYNNKIRQSDQIITNNNLNGQKDLEQSYVVEADVSYYKLRLLTGIRYTYNQHFGNNLSPRLSLLYSLNEESSMKLIYGQSYRSPSLFELYFVNPDSTIFGNSYLKPEKLSSVELAYIRTFKHFYFQLLGFYSQNSNKIQRVLGDAFVDGTVYSNQLVYTNVNDFNVQGIELELKYSNPKYIQSFIHMAYMQGDNGDRQEGADHYNSKYIPNFQLSVGAQKDYKSGIYWSILYNYLNGMEGAFGKVDNLNNFNFNVGFKHEYKRTGIMHTISLKNLLSSNSMFPEYVRRNVNSIPSGVTPYFMYSVKMDIF